MNKKLKLSLFLVPLLLLASCGGNNPETSETSESTTSETSENHDVDLDVGDAPTFEEDSISFHYWRTDGTYTGWDMWLWEVGYDGASFTWNGKDDWGVVAAYPLSTWNDAIANGLGFLVRQGGDSWTSKDCGGSDLFIDFSLYDKDENGIYHVYLKTGDSNVYLDTEGNMKGKISMSVFADTTHVSVRTNLKMTTLILKQDDVTIVTYEEVGNTYKRFTLPDDGVVNYASYYEVTVTLENGDILTSEVSKTLIYNTDEFNNEYAYDGDLGAIYSANSTTFRVWSPVSTTITLKLYDTGTPASLGGSDACTTYEMTKGEKGVFEVEVSGDLNGKYYTYEVTNSSYTEKEVVDPYAKACGINGVRGMVIDLDTTDPDGWSNVEPIAYDRKELTVYETHVADITSSSTWGGTAENAKLFNGAYEEGTTYTEGGVTVATGFDHIKELGVNAVQLIPIFDQSNDEENMTFNWGYNPLNYNCVEGGYSSDPYNGEVRIKELKQLIMAYNKAGINIIMDVVYNHVFSANGSNFDVLMPGYYFRYTDAMELSNGSGCGNETASENYMMHKFIVDSATYWAEEYKLGGFRFDLMGLHDLDTMADLTASCQQVNSSIVIYGEPWQGGTSTLSSSDAALQANGNKYEGYGAFNDQIRDSLIKGGLSGATEVGWITNNTSSIQTSDANKLIAGIKGTTSASVTIADPDKTVNYVTCHDNYTLYDRIVATGKFDEVEDAEAIERMNVLANSVVFTSQGTTFMLAGEEFLRTKQGNSNSYNASYEVNELDYSLLIDHQDMYESYQKLIALKQDFNGLHMDATEASSISVSMSSDKSYISYSLVDPDGTTEYKIVHVNGLGTTDTFDFSGYTLYWSTIEGDAKVLSSATSASAYETIIAYK